MFTFELRRNFEQCLNYNNMKYIDTTISTASDYLSDEIILEGSSSGLNIMNVDNFKQCCESLKEMLPDYTFSSWSNENGEYVCKYLNQKTIEIADTTFQIATNYEQNYVKTIATFAVIALGVYAAYKFYYR